MRPPPSPPLQRAGVGRVAVYRHFPDERSLLTARTSHYFTVNPPPDPTAWAVIDDPDERLGAVLAGLYAFYGRTEGRLARAEQDAPANPILTELLTPFTGYLTGIRDILMQGHRDDPLVVALLGHAVAFGTWRSLTREHGLDDVQAISLMRALVGCAS